MDMLHQALYCTELFDEVIIHVNDYETANKIKIPEGNVRILVQEELITPQEALNQAIHLTTSEFILPMTDDDFFHIQNLQYLLKFLKEGDGNFDIIHYPIMAGFNKHWKKWGDNPEITLNKLWEQNLIPFSSVYRKKVWEKVGGYKKEVPFSDWLFWLEACNLGFNFYYLDNPIYYHREGHKETLSNKESKIFNKNMFLKYLDNKNE